MRVVLIILLAFSSILLLAQASLEELSTADMEKMERGKVITKKRRLDNKIIVVAHGIVIGNSRNAFDVLMECDKHTEFMPNFVACESFYEDADSIYGKTVIDPPMTKKMYPFFYLPDTITPKPTQRLPGN